MTIELFRLLVITSAAAVGASWFLVHERARGRAEARWLERVLLAELLLVSSYLFENLSSSLSGKIFWDSVQLLLDGIIAGFYFRFAASYAGRSFARPGWILAALLFVPAVAAIVMATSGLHGLTRGSARLIEEPMLRLTYDFELLDYLVFLEMYGLLFVSIGLFSISGALRHRIYVGQVAFLLVGVALPALSVFTFARFTLLGERDLSPFFFALGAVLSTIGIIRSHVFDLTPFGRDLLIDSQGDALVVIDGTARVLDANPAARPFLGWPLVVGRPLVETFPAFTELDLRGRDGGGRVEIDGRVWELRRYPIEGDAVLLVGRDVTHASAEEASLERAKSDLEARVVERTRQLEEANATLRSEVLVRQRAEEAARANEKKFRAIFDNAQQLFGLLDGEGRVLEANFTLLDVAGLLVEDLLGKELWGSPWLLASPAQIPVFEAAWREALAGRAARFEAVFGDAHGIHLDGSFKPLVTEGRVELVIFEGYDVTLAHEAARERTQMNAEREHAERIRLLGRLAGSVAHDFNNLLTVMMAATSILRETTTNEESREAIRDIEHATESATLVTRQLLAFSRREGGEIEPTDAHAILRRTSALLVRLLGERHQLSLELTEAQPFLLIDPGQLEQCLLNLVVNAKDAMPEGGTVRVRTRIVRPSTPGAGSGEYLVITVEDTGVGMTEEVRRQVFEAFFTTKPSGRGTGLGLATVRRIVEGAQGFVELQSNPGQGSVFELYFPLCDPRERARPVADVRELTGTETIVLVEDVAAVRGLVGRELRRWGYDVRSFASAEQALQGLGTNPPRPLLLVTDVILPGRDGVSLAAILREREPSLRVIYTTGYSGDVAFPELDDPSAQLVLYKPYRAVDLALCIRRLVQSTPQKIS